jgi:hypothetical protein
VQHQTCSTLVVPPPGPASRPHKPSSRPSLCVSPVLNSFRSILLEKKLEAEAEQLEHKEAQLTEVLARANLDPTLLGRVRARPQSSSRVSHYLAGRCSQSRKVAICGHRPHGRLS